MHVVAPVQRKVLHLPLIDHARHFAGGSVHCLSSRGRSDLNSFRQLARLKCDINRKARIGRQNILALQGLLESFLFGQYRVDARRQVRHSIEPALVSGCRAHEISGRVSYSDGSVRDNRA